MQHSGGGNNIPQDEVYAWLKAHSDKWWTQKEIAASMGVEHVTRVLAVLRRWGEVEWKRDGKGTYWYKYKPEKEQVRELL